MGDRTAARAAIASMAAAESFGMSRAEVAAMLLKRPALLGISERRIARRG